jgi:hypothetical protein
VQAKATFIVLQDVKQSTENIVLQDVKQSTENNPRFLILSERRRKL